MDVYERRVLRRKRPILAETMGFSYSDQKKYKELGLLTVEMLPDIMVETTEFGQMFKFLDAISPKKDGLETLYTALVDHGLDWLVGEMKVEVQTERGQLEVEEYVYREAGMIVHRQFGDTSRISEVDKKEIQLLLALRYQAGKEAWHQYIEEVKGQCRRIEEWKVEECTRLKQLIDKVKIFLKIQQKHINALVHDTQTPPELLKDESGQEINIKTDYLILLENVVSHLLSVLTRIIFEKENMTDERKKCLELLHVKKPATQLDTILHYALSNAEADTVTAKREAELSDKIVQSLDTRMKAMQLKHDHDLMDKQRHIAHQDHMINEKEAQIRGAEKKVKDVTQKLEEVTEELKKWKTRAELLEKTRRLGYYTPGWYDRLYNINGIDYSRQSEPVDKPPPLVQRAGVPVRIQGNVITQSKHRACIVTRPKSGLKSYSFQRRQQSFVKIKRPLSNREDASKENDRVAWSLDTNLTYHSSYNC